MRITWGVALTLCLLALGGFTPIEASHPLVQSPWATNYLFRSLEAPDGSTVFYKLCDVGGRSPAAEWSTAVENWDSAMSWSFNATSCASNANAVLAWEGYENFFCQPNAWACAVIPLGDPGFVGNPHVGHYDFRINEARVIFDQNAWDNILPDLPVYPPGCMQNCQSAWRVWDAAHEFGHLMSLADHVGDNACFAGNPSIMDSDPNLLGQVCPQVPTPWDLNSVWCNVYALCVGVRVAAGDVDGDGCDEIITAPGPGQRPFVRVWDALLGNCITSTSGYFARWTFLAYDEAFLGGVYVGAGNIDGSTAADEVITGAGQGGGPHVRTWKFVGTSTIKVGDFYAYGIGFTGGVRVGAGNLDCVGAEEILAAPGPGGTFVQTHRLDGSQLSPGGFAPYGDTGFTGGIFVAGGNLTTAWCGDEIATGPDVTGGPDVRAWCCSSGSTRIGRFYAYDPAFAGGVRLAVGNQGASTVSEIITAAGPTGGPHVKVFTLGGTTLSSFYAYDIGFTGGVFVASGNVNAGGYNELITGADPGGGPHVKIYTCCVTLSLVEDFYAWIPPGANPQPP